MKRLFALGLALALLVLPGCGGTNTPGSGQQSSTESLLESTSASSSTTEEAAQLPGFIGSWVSPKGLVLVFNEDGSCGLFKTSPIAQSNHYWGSSYEFSTGATALEDAGVTKEQDVYPKNCKMENIYTVWVKYDNVYSDGKVYPISSSSENDRIMVTYNPDTDSIFGYSIRNGLKAEFSRRETEILTLQDVAAEGTASGSLAQSQPEQPQPGEWMTFMQPNYATTNTNVNKDQPVNVRVVEVTDNQSRIQHAAENSFFLEQPILLTFLEENKGSRIILVAYDVQHKEGNFSDSWGCSIPSGSVSISTQESMTKNIVESGENSAFCPCALAPEDPLGSVYIGEVARINVLVAVPDWLRLEDIIVMTVQDLSYVVIPR